MDNAKKDYTYDMTIKIKDIEHKYYESERFKIINEPKKNIIYSHLSDSDAFICLQSNKDMYIDIRVSANIDISIDAIQNDDMHKLEDVLLGVAKDFADFFTKSKIIGTQGEEEYDTFLGLNNRLTLLTVVEGFMILGCAYLQYSMLKYYLRNRAK